MLSCLKWTGVLRKRFTVIFYMLKKVYYLSAINRFRISIYIYWDLITWGQNAKSTVRKFRLPIGQSATRLFETTAVCHYFSTVLMLKFPFLNMNDYGINQSFLKCDYLLKAKICILKLNKNLILRLTVVNRA